MKLVGEFTISCILNSFISLFLAEDGMIQEEYLLSRTIMQELCTEAAKLKILGAMEMIPTEKLVRLLNVLELNIRGGDRVSPISDVNLL